MPVDKQRFEILLKAIVNIEEEVNKHLENSKLKQKIENIINEMNLILGELK